MICAVSCGPHTPSPVDTALPQVVKAGRTIATVSVEIRQKATGTLVALGKHIKFLHASEKPLISEEDVRAMVKRYSNSNGSSSTQSKL